MNFLRGEQMKSEIDGSLAGSRRALLFLAVIGTCLVGAIVPIQGQEAGTGLDVVGEERTTDPRLQRRIPPVETVQTQENSGWRYFRALGVVAGVIGVGLVGFWFFRRFIPGALTRNESSLLQVVARVPVSPRHQVALVAVGERIIVIGISPERVDRLAEIDDPDEVFRLLPQVPIGDQLAAVEGEVETTGTKSTPVMPPEFQRDVERVRNLVASWGEGEGQGQEEER